MKKVITFIALVLVALLFVRCGDDGGGPTTPATTTVPLSASVNWVVNPSIANGRVYVNILGNLHIQGSIKNSGNGTAYDVRIKFEIYNTVSGLTARQKTIYCNPRTINAGQTINNDFNLGYLYSIPNWEICSVKWEIKWRNPSGSIETSSGELLIQNLSQP